MGWEGLEPSTNALKGRCSTIELPTRVLEASGERYPSVVSEARGFRPVIFSLSLDRRATTADSFLLAHLYSVDQLTPRDHIVSFPRFLHIPRNEETKIEMG